MRQLQSLIWKEWHETQLFLWIAWFLFIVLPIVGGLEGRFTFIHRFEFNASMWVLMLGPVVAIVVGVAVTCRDMQPKLEDFWQSRPIGSTRLFVIKYFVALAVILLGCEVPMLIEISLRQKNSIDVQVFWVAFVWLAAFSVAFAVGCVVRRTAHAAAISVVGLLLLFFLPVVFPPLGRFAISRLQDWISDPTLNGKTVLLPPLTFAAGMVTVSAALGVVGLLAVRRHWQIESSKPLIYGAISAAFLILIASASYQLGTNLPILSRVDLPAGEVVGSIWLGPVQSTIYSYQAFYRSDQRKTYERAIKISQSALSLGRPHAVSEEFPWAGEDGCLTLSSPDSMVGYAIDSTKIAAESYITQLRVVSLSHTAPTQSTRIDLWPSPREPAYQRFEEGFCYALRDRLYVAGLRTIVFDISDPTHPRRLSELPLRWRPMWFEDPTPTAAINLPPVPGLTAEQRLQFAMHVSSRFGPAGVFEGSTWCLCDRGTRRTLSMYRLTTLDEDVAKFSLVKTYKPTLVQVLAGTSTFNGLSIHNGFLYATAWPNFLSVFDLNGNKPLSLVAHFAASKPLLVCKPLPDGRVLVAGESLYLLGPPPRH